VKIKLTETILGNPDASGGIVLLFAKACLHVLMVAAAAMATAFGIATFITDRTAQLWTIRMRTNKSQH
jgi:hypothetical protein